MLNSFDIILPWEYNHCMYKTIYHGSSHIIRKPNLGLGKAYNDFGIGFYCTEDFSGASEWAVKGNKNGFVSSYSIDCKGLRIIDLCGPQYTALHWISLLFNYREFDASTRLMHDAREYISKEFTVDYQGADCIIGYSADSFAFSLTSDFLNGRLSYRNLKNALHDVTGSRQFVLKSNRAFDRILYTGYSPASSAEFYSASGRKGTNIIKKAHLDGDEGDLSISQLLEEGIKSYDMRLR